MKKWAQREKIIFHRMREGGATYREIGERLGKSMAAVKQYASRCDALVKAREYANRYETSLCWKCELANGSLDPVTMEPCPWAQNLTPVPGWTIKEEPRSDGDRGVFTGKTVVQCPLFREG